MRFSRWFLWLTTAVCQAMLAGIQLLHADDGDFKPLYNGKDLSGWDGDTRLWTVQDGLIRGETAFPNRLTFNNTFLIWRGGVLKDFELKLKFRISSGNSGVQYRSKDLGDHVVGGYQAEIANEPGVAGFLYDEKGRKYLANVGEIVRIGTDGKPAVTGQIRSKEELMKQGYYKEKDWNEYRIVAKGNHLEHYLNGFKTVDVTDNDTIGGASEGILALQIHAGGPMLVEFKEILLKNL